jgi:hypothetical protein
MAIAQQPKGAKNRCAGEDSSGRSAPPGIGVAGVASLESLTTSLVAGEVSRWRICAAEEQAEAAKGPIIVPLTRAKRDAANIMPSPATTSLLTTIKNACKAVSGTFLESLNDSRVVQRARIGLEAALVCVGKFCKILRQERENTALDSVFLSPIRSPAEKALSGVSRCINVVRDWIFDSVSAQKTGVKTAAEKMHSDYHAGDVSIPKVVLTPRRESQRSEGRRRSRGIPRRREPVVLEEDSYGVEEEPILAPVQIHDRPEIEETEDEQRTSRVYRRIRDIDRQYGTKPSNPEVAELLRQLGTPYDSVERAIELVYALQQEELLEAQREEVEALVPVVQVVEDMACREGKSQKS